MQCASYTSPLFRSLTVIFIGFYFRFFTLFHRCHRCFVYLKNSKKSVCDSYMNEFSEIRFPLQTFALFHTFTSTSISISNRHKQICSKAQSISIYKKDESNVNLHPTQAKAQKRQISSHKYLMRMTCWVRIILVMDNLLDLENRQNKSPNSPIPNRLAP